MLQSIFFFQSPLEQFEILPLIFLPFGYFDFSITNQTIMLILILMLFSVLFFGCLKQLNLSLYIVPSRLQSTIEFAHKMLLTMVTSTIHGKRNQLFFPLVYTIFFFIVCMNLIGLVPYSFTVTSHFVVTLFISLSCFIGMNIIGVRAHKLNLFSLFLPAGTSVALSFLLVPIELLSYIFKPLSLAIRLFCNMMAGHTLLKVFVGFAWSLMSISGFLFLLQYVPLLILFPLFVLEIGIAIVQAYVFSLLTCMYLNDVLNLH